MQITFFPLTLQSQLSTFLSQIMIFNSISSKGLNVTVTALHSDTVQSGVQLSHSDMTVGTGQIEDSLFVLDGWRWNVHP